MDIKKFKDIKIPHYLYKYKHLEKRYIHEPLFETYLKSYLLKYYA